MLPSAASLLQHQSAEANAVMQQARTILPAGSMLGNNLGGAATGVLHYKTVGEL